MIDVGSSPEESARRTALARYDILDTPAEAEFDDIVRVASDACGMPVSLISLLDTNRQWFKARTGFARSETTLRESICAQAVTQHDLFEIRDTTLDDRTADNPLVVGDPHVRFYAGVPLETSDGIRLGTLCVLDTKPNQLTPAQGFVLRTLARQVMTTLELRRALKERRESDRRNAAILDSALDYAVVSMTLTGHITSWSRGAERILGWTEDEMLGRHADIFFTGEDVAAGISGSEMRMALRQGRGADERWHRRKDGSLFWANGEMMPLRDEHGTPEGFIKILRDRTEQRNAAAKQHADAEFMRGVLASSADCIKVLDLDGRLSFMSEIGKCVMEVRDFDEIRGRPWPDFWRGQGNTDAKAAMAAARAGATGHFQGEADTVAGTLKWWDVQVTPILDGDGQPARLLVVSRDMTDQKTAERTLSASESRWRGLFTNMREGFFLAEIVRDAEGLPSDYRFLEINPAFAAQLGLPVESVGRTIRSFVPDIDRRVIDIYARTVDTGEPQTFEIQVPGSNRWFEGRSLKDAGQRFSCLFLDITERKQTELRRAATIELGDRLRDLSDKSEIAYAAADILGRTLGLSRAGYAAVDAERETFAAEREWTSGGDIGPAGGSPFRNSGCYIEQLKRGDIVRIDDIASDPRTAGDEASWRALDARALVNLPIMERGRVVALFFLMHASAHSWTDEEIGFAREVADRTRAAIARVEAEEQQHVLNLELSHRMKNMLSMAQSIATQTMRNATDIDSAKDVLAGRLIALGKSHDLLLGGALNSTSLAALIENALALHQDGPDRIGLQGPSVKVGAKAAMSLSLILHELATNAAKYGAFSNDVGRVNLTWDIVADGGNPLMRLRWVETGGPPVTPPTRTGFGSRLIGRGLARDFGGEATLTYPSTGVVCTIEASLDDLQSEANPDAKRARTVTDGRAVAPAEATYGGA